MKLVSLYSTIKMMNGPINIRWKVFIFLIFLMFSFQFLMQWPYSRFQSCCLCKSSIFRAALTGCQTRGIFFLDLKATINFLFVSTVPGGATAALELTPLHVPLLSLRPGAECQRECLYTHSHRGGSAPGHPSTFEVGAHGRDAGTIFRSFGPNQLNAFSLNLYTMQSSCRISGQNKTAGFPSRCVYV